MRSVDTGKDARTQIDVDSGAVEVEILVREGQGCQLRILSSAYWRRVRISVITNSTTLLREGMWTYERETVY